MKTKSLTTKPRTLTQKALKYAELIELKKKIQAEIDEYNTELLQAMLKNDVEQLKTGSYTIYRAKRVTVKVLDVPLLKKSLDYARIPYETEESFKPYMSTVFRNIIANGQELTGLGKSETEYIGVKLRDKEDK